ncbi:MAG TPA: TetR/AcrR family transcriptional regulator, partial [Acidimicrobiales bacterium]|nr:TetR/AcrR family transcriptional regulator [Acidimicrobiales bacterium]
GSSDFTVAEVAAKAGVALRTFYRQFAGRDELLLALFEEEARQGAELLQDSVTAEGTTPIEHLRGYVVGLCRLLDVGSGYASLLVREHLRLGESHPEELRVALAPIVDLLEEQLQAAAASGDLRPVDRHDAVVVFTAVLAHVHASVLFTEGERSEVSAERLWDFCHAALRATAASELEAP